MKLNDELKGYIEVLITGIVWGFIGLCVKELIRHGATTNLAAFFRLFFAFVFSFFVSIFTYKKEAFKLTKEELFWCVLDGVLTFGLFNVLYNISVSEAGVAISSVLLYTSPVYNAIVSRIVFKEKIGLKKALILGINIIGCIIAATGLDFSFTSVSLFGIIMGGLAGLFYGLAPVLGKYIFNRKSEVYIVSMYNQLFGSLFILIFCNPFKDFKGFNAPMLLYALILGCIVTGVAYMFYYDGVKRIKNISNIPVIASIEIVIASLIGLFIYNENLTMLNLFGMALVIISIVFISRIKN